MMKRLNTPAGPAHKRRGVTLTEVLMSMLIMSIGVSFVAAVFPLSVLRSIQGAQMTSATIHRYQAEAMIDMFPNIIHNPDGIPAAGLDPTSASGTVPDTPRPNTFREHFGTNYIVDPWGYHIHGLDGATYGGGSLLCPSDPSAANPFWGVFGVDRNGVPSLLRFDGGIHAQTVLSPNSAPWNELRERLAATLSASTDRWEEVLNTDQFEVVTDVSGNAIGITFGTDVDLNGLDNPAGNANAGVIPDPEINRITVFHGDGRHSQAYPITSISGQTVLWTESGVGDLNVDGVIEDRLLPQSYQITGGGFDISHVTIDASQMRLFSWIMSVRKRGDGNAGVDVAVIFNRGVDPTNEHAYFATFVPKTNLVAIDRDVGDPEPFIKKGGYILDAQNCRWYRIQDFKERPLIGTWDYGPYEYVVFTEDRILEPGGEDTYVDASNRPTFNQTWDQETDGNGNGVADPSEDTNGNGILDNEDRDRDGNAPEFGRAVFLPGVIQVYPLGTKTVPEDL